jgi:hypothetical protein
METSLQNNDTIVVKKEFLIEYSWLTERRVFACNEEEAIKIVKKEVGEFTVGRIAQRCAFFTGNTDWNFEDWCNEDKRVKSLSKEEREKYFIESSAIWRKQEGYE